MTKKIESIQALRAVAVILVVYIHSFVSNQDSVQYHFFYLPQWGAIGVDLFFVISGFIMTTIMPSYIGGPSEAGIFLIKRLIRIFPLYWLISLAVILIGFRTISIQTESILKTLVFFPVIDKDHFIFPVIPPGWTLPYEVFFYLIIFTVLVIVKKRQLGTVLAILLTLSVCGGLFHSSSILITFLTCPLLCEFIFGIIIGVVYNKVRYKNYAGNRLLAFKTIAVVALLVGVLSMAATIFTGVNAMYIAEILTTDNSLALTRVMIWGVPSSFLVLGLLFCEHFFNLKIPTLLVRLGNASYSCYLVHFTFIRKLDSLLLHFNIKINQDIRVELFLVSSLALSLFLYRHAEERLLENLNRRFLPAKKAFRPDTVNLNR